MERYLYKTEEEQIKKIMYELLGSDYIREISDYNTDFLAFISETEDIEKELDQNFLNNPFLDNPQGIINYVKQVNSRRGFRDEHLQMLFMSGEHNILFAISDVIYTAVKENYTYELLKKGKQEDIVKEVKKTQGYLDLFLKINEYNEELRKYKYKLPKEISLESLLRKTPDIQVHPIAKLKKDKLFYLTCMQDELDKSPGSFSRGTLFLYDSEDLVPLNVLIMPNFLDFGLSYRKKFLEYLT